jgi:hypothetical protein
MIKDKTKVIIPVNSDPLSRFPQGGNANTLRLIGSFLAPSPVGESLPRFGGGWVRGLFKQEGWIRDQLDNGRSPFCWGVGGKSSLKKVKG